MNTPKRIVCYAINGSGLGHLTRLISVGRWLRRFVALLDHRPPEVIFLTSSDASDALARAGFASFKIPSKTVATKAELDKLEYRRLAKHFIWNSLGVFSPDLLVVDTFPSGSFDELFQVLDGPFKKGFIYRNVKPEYAARATFRSALGLYDTVVVPHRRHNGSGKGLLSDQDSTEQAAMDLEPRYCGEVIQFDRDEMLPPSIARAQLGVAAEDRFVYVSAGGGGDPDAEATLTSLMASVQRVDNVHLLVGAGPLYRGPRLAGPRITWFDAPDVWKYFAAVDAAVCAAGYNTFHELLYAQVPTAFYAQPKIADDQALRISDAEQSGACRQVSFRHISHHQTADLENSNLVAEQVRELLEPAVAAAMREACTEMLSGNGARQCALELIRPLYDQSRLDWAAGLLTPRLTHSLECIGNGSTRVLADWLTPLMPRGQMDSMSTHPGLNGVLSRLSPAAAQEVEQVLAERDEALDQSTFESSLVDLLNTIDVYQAGEDPANDGAGVAGEVLKTMVAAMKRQPLEVARNGNRTRWICSVVNGIHTLARLDVGLTIPDVLRLFRLFPRIVDADVREAIELFVRFLKHCRSVNEPTHEIMHRLQVLKMSHAKVTQATLDTLLKPSTALGEPTT